LAGLYVQDLYVAPSYRRWGVGRALLAALAAEARTRGLGFLWWASRAWSTEAHAFFRRFATVEEPVLAFATFGEKFEQLAAEGKPPARVPEDGPTQRRPRRWRPPERRLGGTAMHSVSAGFPATLEIGYPDRERNRLTTFFRLFTVIPIGVILALVTGGGGGGHSSSHAFEPAVTATPRTGRSRSVRFGRDLEEAPARRNRTRAGCPRTCPPPGAVAS
jgi:hypothetical protein